MTMLLPKWVYTLELVDRHNLSQLAKVTNCTFSHTSKIVNDFNDRGWIIILRTGRTNKMVMTTKGKIVQNLCKELLIVLHNKRCN